MEKYTSHNWLLSDTYNTFISVLVEKFDSLTPSELTMVADSFTRVGLQQDDILFSIVDKIEKIYEETSGSGAAARTLSFRTAYLPLLQSFVRVNFTETPAFQKLLSDEFFSKAVTNKVNFFDFAAKESSVNVPLLATILAGNLDQKDPRFK